FLRVGIVDDAEIEAEVTRCRLYACIEIDFVISVRTCAKIDRRSPCARIEDVLAVIDACLQGDALITLADAAEYVIAGQGYIVAYFGRGNACAHQGGGGNGG